MTFSIRKPNRVRHSHTQSIEASPDDVFVLLCPVREADWIADWKPDWVISDSGLVERGCIFQTPADKPEAAPAVWVVTEHDPNARHVEMIKVIPGLTVTRLEITARGDERGGTHLDVTYEFTALSKAGDAAVADCTSDWYRGFMHDWETAMNHYLAT